ncbi:MAG: tryptophan--tRNA ligase [Clostridiaceae bacterium]|jgi:tryptophanyl-tRNA synthetase|nr:tryptophan--tRNA ligase [Clostridiaceae bacterium]
MIYNKEKKVLYSAIQPTNLMTLGNYLGAIKNWVKLQDEYNCFYAIADLHALTVTQEPADFRAKALSLFAQLIACGIDPDKSLLYFQSHVPAHAELQWVLCCNTYLGEAYRMTQFKDKSQKHAENVNVGLLAYPVLMAADILLYQASLVPVGQDQKQHLEISRDIAIRMNNKYGGIFTVPEPYITVGGARIMSLQNPEAKMSKSDTDVNATVELSDDKDTVIRKFKRAVTDCGAEIVAREDKPGITNLLNIYSETTGKTVAEAEKEFEGKGYGDFKLAVGEAVADKLAPVRAEHARLLKEKSVLSDIIRKNGLETRAAADRTLVKVYKKIGLVPKDNK